MKRFINNNLKRIVALLILVLAAMFGVGEFAPDSGTTAGDSTPAYDAAVSGDSSAQSSQSDTGDAVTADPGDTDTDSSPDEDHASIAEDGSYTTKEDVALYIHTYGRLPDNFITKAQAGDLGWTGGGLEEYAPGCCIGGDKFGNREGLLPKADGRQYYECDIDTLGAHSRGPKRIVYSNDGLIYYTDDHYASFTLLYGSED